MTSYILTQDAADDLVHIFSEGTKLFGQSQAFLYRKGLENIFSLLAVNPKMGLERPEISRNIRIYSYKSHIIVYELDGEIPLILQVRHHREDWTKDV